MDLPDAPWVVESWYTGDCPGYTETPYERCGADDFLEGADADFGWVILAWELNIDSDSVEDDQAMQSVWNELTEKARKAHCKAFEQYCRDDAEELYNRYWREYRQ